MATTDELPCVHGIYRSMQRCPGCDTGLTYLGQQSYHVTEAPVVDYGPIREQRMERKLDDILRRLERIEQKLHAPDSD